MTRTSNRHHRLQWTLSTASSWWCLVAFVETTTTAGNKKIFQCEAFLQHHQSHPPKIPSPRGPSAGSSSLLFRSRPFIKLSSKESEQEGDDDRTEQSSLSSSSLLSPLDTFKEDIQNRLLLEDFVNGNLLLSDLSSSSLPLKDIKKAVKRKSKKFRMTLFAFICDPKVEVVAALAVLLSSFLVALSTLNDLPKDVECAISSALLALDVSFATDFFLRWYAAGQFKIRYLTTPLALIDLVVVILPLMIGTIMPLMNIGLDAAGITHPIHMPNNGDTSTTNSSVSLFSQAGLQNLLLLRVLRLRRVLTDMTTFRRFASAFGIGTLWNNHPTTSSHPSHATAKVRPYQLQLARVLLSIFTLLSVSTGLIYTAEHDVNPNIPDYFTALYFGLTTLTTVGFGDITPITPAGRLVVCGSILAGVAIIPAQAAKLVEALLEFQSELNKSNTNPATVASLATVLQREIEKNQQQQLERRRLLNGGAAADGLGPSGTNIEIPPKEDDTVKIATKRNSRSGASSSSTTTTTTMISLSKSCFQCGESSHREDALFCWSCGNELLGG